MHIRSVGWSLTVVVLFAKAGGCVMQWEAFPAGTYEARRFHGHVRIVQPDGQRVDVYDARAEFPTLQGRLENGTPVAMSLTSIPSVEVRRVNKGAIVGYALGFGIPIAVCALVVAFAVGLSHAGG